MFSRDRVPTEGWSGRVGPELKELQILQFVKNKGSTDGFSQ